MTLTIDPVTSMSSAFCVHHIEYLGSISLKHFHSFRRYKGDGRTHGRPECSMPPAWWDLEVVRAARSA